MVRRIYIIYHEDFRLHSIELAHPENPVRFDLGLEGIRGLAGIVSGRRVRLIEPPTGSLGIFKRVHSSSYVDWISSILRSRKTLWLDSDTYVSSGSIDALSRLAGAVQRAIVLALRGESSLILGRPPSHHAGFNGRAMGAPSQGFCIFNATALIGSILSKHGKTVIVDFDVHHGNGTQEILYNRGDITHIDIHQDPSTTFPYTGYPDQIGDGEGRGTKINIVVPPISGDDIYLDALRLVEIILDYIKPDFIVASAGFDAFRGDTDAVLSNVGSKFYYMIGRLLSAKNKIAVVTVLEGGYGDGLRRGLPAYIAGLLGVRKYPLDPMSYSSRGAWKLYWEYKRHLINNIIENSKIMLPEEYVREYQYNKWRTIKSNIRRKHRRARKRR
ncbi:MAG: hypothetical protein QXD80_04120 [Acidilobaceae archaeon]